MTIKIVAHQADRQQRVLEEVEDLNAHPQEARQYNRLKERLVRQYPDDREKYTLGMTDFIHSIDLKAKEWKRNR